MTRPLKEVLQEYEDLDIWEPAKYHQLIKALKQARDIWQTNESTTGDHDWWDEEIAKILEDR